MKTNLLKFLEHVQAYPNCIPREKLNSTLTCVDIEALKVQGLLTRGSDLREYCCTSCESPHLIEVKPSTSGPYTYCAISDYERNHINAQEIETWQFQVPEFIKMLALSLKIIIQQEKMEVDSLWQIGTMSKDVRHIYYYYQGDNEDELLEFINSQASQHRRFIILFAKKPSLTFEGKHEVVLLWLNDFVELNKTGIRVMKSRFDRYLQQELRNVFFDKVNGELKVNGQLIVEVQPSTPEYYYIDILWNNFNYPVSHEAIKAHILKELGKKTDSTSASDYTKSLRSRINKTAQEKQIFNKLIVSRRNLKHENGYKMGNVII